MKRIFVRGLSRSGGTLMVTILDAHPDVAMCYEIYEHLLVPESGEDGVTALKRALAGKPPGRPRLSRILHRTPLAAILEPRLQRRPARAQVDPGIERFVGRARRCGVDEPSLRRLLDGHVDAGRSFGTLAERMGFVERVALEKARNEGKRHWGTKINSKYRDVRELFPDAYFLFMLRDGRDIAASRKLVGDFDKPIDAIARGWCRQIASFQAFAVADPAHARLVRYERLATEPETELRAILEFLGLPWTDGVLNYHQQDLTLYRDPTGHLSAEQVHQPISTASLGRWKRDLTEGEIGMFESVASDTLDAMGYQRSSETP